MFGLAKVANDLNLNYSSREDRLLDELENARTDLAVAESRRDPELVTRGTDAWNNSALKGAGIGAAIGGGIGAALPRRLGQRVGVGLAGAVTGGIAGLIPGGLVGTYKENKILNEDDPEVLEAIENAKRTISNNKDVLERHYLTRQRVLEEEARRQQAQRNIYGY